MSTNGPGVPYATPAALLAAIEARLRQNSAEGRPLPDLRRQLAHERLCARVFQDPAEGWVLKGGVGLFTRLTVAGAPGMRHTRDVDLYQAGTAAAAAAARLQQLISTDIGDHFTFTVEAAQPTHIQGDGGYRVSVTARLGSKVFDRFPIDVTADQPTDTTPDVLQPVPVLNIPGLQPPPYRLYPVVNHVADKLAAMVERHNGDTPSTRYRDLVDLVLIALSHPLDATRLHAAVTAELNTRHLPVITTVPIPAPAWESGYQGVAAGVTGLDAYRTLTPAIELVRQFLDPVLSGGPSAALPAGPWDPATRSWTTSTGTVTSTPQREQLWSALARDTDPRLVTDPHWPVITAALHRIAAAAGDPLAVLQAALQTGPLPEDHPGRSLHYRLINLDPAAATPAPKGHERPESPVSGLDRQPAIAPAPGRPRTERGPRR